MSELLYTELGSKVSQVPVYETTNVRDYIKSDGMPYVTDAVEPPDEYPGSTAIDVERFENIFPPFPSFWMEFRDTKDGEVIRCAVLWETEKSEGWVFTGTIFWDDSRGTLQFPFAVNMQVSKDGKPLGMDFTAIEKNIPSAIATQSMVLIGTVGMTSLLALSFLNMHKNSVTVVDNAPSRQVRRAAERQRKRPPPTFKTIVVRGMGQNRGADESCGESTCALHIVRGHMIRGTAEHPLFGKPWGVGTFWVASFTKGHAKYGDQRDVPFRIKLAS